MSQEQHSRGRFLVAVAAGGATVAAGGIGVLVTNAGGQSSYHQAIGSTWLHSINQPVEVPSLSGQFATNLGTHGKRPDLVMTFGYGPDLPESLRRPVGQVIVEA